MYVSGLWKGIRKDWEVLATKISFSVGDQRWVRCWNDKCGNSSSWKVEVMGSFLARLQGKKSVWMCGGFSGLHQNK